MLGISSVERLVGKGIGSEYSSAVMSAGKKGLYLVVMLAGKRDAK
jgi:hypothetical protein